MEGRTVQVVGDDGGTRLLSYKKAMIATGASPFVPKELLSEDSAKEDSRDNSNGDGSTGSLSRSFLTSQSFFNLTELPPRLLVLGSGPIGLEVGYGDPSWNFKNDSSSLQTLSISFGSWHRVWLDWAVESPAWRGQID